MIKHIKVFISQPMQGKSDDEILAERESAIEALKKLITEEEYTLEIIDSFFKKDATNLVNPAWHLGESIKMLGEADIVYFCKDWHKYSGCYIEHLCASKYDKIILYGQ